MARMFYSRSCHQDTTNIAAPKKEVKRDIDFFFDLFFKNALDFLFWFG